jgi:hypothetical protein
MSTILRQRVVSRVTIATFETDHGEIHTSHGTDQPIGTCSLVLPLPLAGNVFVGATVTVEAGTDGDYFANPIFVGYVREIGEQADARAKTVTVRCEGHHHRLAYPLVQDVAYAGGAGTSPALLVSDPHHLGDNTIGNYAVPATEGTSYNADWTPLVDSSFIRLTGKLHGTNNDLGDTESLRMTHFDRVEIRQGGQMLGWAILPAHTDDLGADYDVVEEYGDPSPPGVWADFAVTIAADIETGGGTATARFIAGYPPGGGRGDHEFQQVRRSTAAKMTAREIIRGLYKRLGFGGGSGISYVVDEITSYSGIVIELGGNGFVDNGQVRFRAGEQPLRAIMRIASLFRYAVFDSPDGVCRVRGVRGAPDPDASVMSFAENTNLLAVRRVEDARPVITYWRVLGASGTDADGNRFRYRSEPDPDDIPVGSSIPNPPGWNYGELSDSLLVSDTLCLYAGNLHEADFSEIPIVLEWETYGRSIQPGRVVTVDAPSVDFSGPLWLTGIRHDIDPRDGGSGYRCTMTGWAGSGSPIDEAPDPDPDEDDLEPGDPQGEDVWRPYTPRAAS